MPTEIEALKTASLLAYPSVYAFCKAHKGKITKSVVNMVLAGKYPGNVEKQKDKIQKILDGYKIYQAKPIEKPEKQHFCEI